jgi:hypothetical protein
MRTQEVRTLSSLQQSTSFEVQRSKNRQSRHKSNTNFESRIFPDKAIGTLRALGTGLPGILLTMSTTFHDKLPLHAVSDPHSVPLPCCTHQICRLWMVSCSLLH